LAARRTALTALEYDSLENEIVTGEPSFAAEAAPEKFATEFPDAPAVVLVDGVPSDV
jgi:hypothetical protein